MKAAPFRTKVDSNIARAKERLEANIKVGRVPTTHAKDARTKFEHSAIELRKVVARVTKDGTVTRGEAREVKAASKTMRAVLRTHD